MKYEQKAEEILRGTARGLRFGEIVIAPEAQAIVPERLINAAIEHHKCQVALKTLFGLVADGDGMPYRSRYAVDEIDVIVVTWADRTKTYIELVTEELVLPGPCSLLGEL